MGVFAPFLEQDPCCCKTATRHFDWQVMHDMNHGCSTAGPMLDGGSLGRDVPTVRHTQARGKYTWPNWFFNLSTGHNFTNGIELQVTGQYDLRGLEHLFAQHSNGKEGTSIFMLKLLHGRLQAI